MPRYAPSDLLESCPPLPDSPPAREPDAAGNIIVAAGRAPSPELLELLRLQPHFQATWDRQRPDLKDQSQSGFDLSLFMQVLQAGGSEQDAVDVAIAHRAQSGDGPKRGDYYMRTLKTAHAGLAAARAARAVVAEEPSPPATAKQPQWPAPPDPGVYHGPVGDFVRLVEPHSEADPLGLAVQLLAGVGSIIGRGPHFLVEGDEHHVNTFSVLLGATSKGRKGTSWGRVRQVLALVDPTWAEKRIQSGLSSGEGLIWAVRDAIMKMEKVRAKEKGDPPTYTQVVADPGIEDKRLIVQEGEFASVLRVLQRDGNTLSAIVRNAWDGRETLQSLTKNSLAKATKAHITIVGHITVSEVRRYLDRTELGNGFANRYCWFCIKRSKVLPEGGSLDPIELMPLIETLRPRVASARELGRIHFDAEARELWRAAYGFLSEGRPGMFGAVTARAEAQCLRWALLYALLDGAREIRAQHLWAAFGLWAYAEESAQFVFGDALGDPMADEILRALRNNPGGMARTAIRNTFSNNKSGEAIGRALGLLAEHGLARPLTTTLTGDRGRPAEIWVATAVAGRTTPGFQSFRSFMSSLPAPNRGEGA